MPFSRRFIVEIPGSIAALTLALTGGFAIINIHVVAVNGNNAAEGIQRYNLETSIV